MTYKESNNHWCDYYNFLAFFFFLRLKIPSDVKIGSILLMSFSHCFGFDTSHTVFSFGALYGGEERERAKLLYREFGHGWWMGGIQKPPPVMTLDGCWGGKYRYGFFRGLGIWVLYCFCFHDLCQLHLLRTGLEDQCFVYGFWVFDELCLWVLSLFVYFLMNLDYGFCSRYDWWSGFRTVKGFVIGGWSIWRFWGVRLVKLSDWEFGNFCLEVWIFGFGLGLILIAGFDWIQFCRAKMEASFFFFWSFIVALLK